MANKQVIHDPLDDKPVTPLSFTDSCGRKHTMLANNKRSTSF